MGYLPDLFKLTKELELLGEKIIYQINWNYSDLHFLSVNLLAQNIHKLKSISLLVEKGLSTDAWPLFRSLIENTLDYYYLTKYPNKVELYFQYATYLDLKRIKRRIMIMSLSGKKFTDEEEMGLKSLEDEWLRHKDKFERNGKIRNYWRDKSLINIAKEAGMEHIYLVGYQEANDHVHGNSNLIKMFVRGKNSSGLLLKVGPTYDDPEIVILLGDSAQLFLNILIFANKTFNLGFDTILEDKKKIFQMPRKEK